MNFRGCEKKYSLGGSWSAKREREALKPKAVVARTVRVPFEVQGNS